MKSAKTGNVCVLRIQEVHIQLPRDPADKTVIFITEATQMNYCVYLISLCSQSGNI